MANESNTRNTFLKGVAACVVAAASLGIIQIGEYSINSGTASSSGDQNYTPGTYTASAKGMDGDVTVTATFDDSSITDLTLDVSGETAGIGAEIGDEMTQKFLDAQSSAVDASTGATVTSDALKEALDDCIAQALGEDNPSAAESKDETEVETSSVTEDTIIEPVNEPLETESLLTEETSQSEAASYTPGTYTASAKGMDGDVTVTATFDDSSITDLTLDVSGETAGIGAEIGDEMTQKFLDAQSSAVDASTGATVTSDALKEALDDCIAQASGNGSAETAETKDETEEESSSAPDENILESIPADTQTETETEASSSVSSDTDKTGTYIPGEYTATVDGSQGDITVSVTFTEDEMVAISYDLSGETEDIGAVIGPEMSSRILDAQSTDVDGVSGATATSDAFKNGVDECIAQAMNESAAISTADLMTGPGPVISGAGTKGNVYVPGTYTASAQGMEGPVSVSLTFNEDSILSVGYDLSGETEDIGAVIGPEISASILEAQSADVDGVSGATATSDAVKSAAADCIEQALAVNPEETETKEVLTSFQDSSYTPGTYTATAQGHGEITVCVLFSEDEMLSISYDLSGEEENIGPEMSSAILESQSADVDDILDAKVTSEAFRQAVRDCMEQAKA